MRRWLRIIGLIIVGLAAGVGLGLYVGWVAWPTEFTDADPTILEEEYRRDYTLMIAAAYAVDGDLETARQRIDSLGPDAQDYLLSLVLDVILEGNNEQEIHQVVQLAADLGLSSPAMQPYLSPPPGATAEPDDA